MKKKYTMDEFEKIYDEAMFKTIEELSKDLVEHAGEKINGMQQLTFTMQNTMAMAELKKQIFKKGDN